MKIDVRTDLKQAQAEFADLAQGLRDRAMVRTLNKVAGSAASSAARATAQRFRLRAASTRKRVRLNPRARKGRLAATVFYGGLRRLPLTAFQGMRQTARGVSFAGAGGGQSIAYGFVRSPKGTPIPLRRVGPKRQPLEFLRLGMGPEYRGRGVNLAELADRLSAATAAAVEQGGRRQIARVAEQELRFEALRAQGRAGRRRG